MFYVDGFKVNVRMLVCLNGVVLWRYWSVKMSPYLGSGVFDSCSVGDVLRPLRKRFIN